MQPCSLTPLLSRLPYAPTGAQARTIDEAMRDMCSGRRMNRLVQGDVGSGKTLVAACCAYLAAQNGRQSAIMAPTELLAAQHYQSLSPLFEGLGIPCGLLTASLPAAEKRRVKQLLREGALSVVFGTHALIEGDVQFQNAGLFVVDEQHRFGVRQRATLSEKASDAHMLVMSATPIPRTLALIIYGDLDVSIIDELPPGRQQVLTYPANEGMRQRVYRFIRKQIDAGGQVYIVCPLVDDEDGVSERQAAQQYTQTLQRDVFPDLRFGLLHGRMKGADKDAVMSAFAAGDLDILVSTTVIEVGVNVPNATLMVVENADQFGLSQLHQLRGRVGRGTRQSYCILMSTGNAKNPRLEAICKTNDGFQIAEEDLKLRGPGDFFGDRQHGLPAFRIADLATDTRVMKAAQESAQEVLARDPELTLPEHQLLRQRVERVFDPQTLVMN